MNDFNFGNILESLLSVLGGGWATVGAAIAVAILGSILYLWLSSKLKKWRQEQDRKNQTKKEGSQVRGLKQRVIDRTEKNQKTKDRMQEIIDERKGDRSP